MKKYEAPDGTTSVCLRISRNENGKRPVWSGYKQERGDSLSLRVTVEIAGGSCLFERFNNKEAAEAAHISRDRHAAWCNAIRFAEQLQAAAPHREYVVSYRPQSQNENEAVCIYQRLKMIDQPEIVINHDSATVTMRKEIYGTCAISTGKDYDNGD